MEIKEACRIIKNDEAIDYMIGEDKLTKEGREALKTIAAALRDGYKLSNCGGLELNFSRKFLMTYGQRLGDDLWTKIRKTADLRGLTIDQLIVSAVEKEISVYGSEETGPTPAKIRQEIHYDGLRGWIF